jgi:hypothetical protein
MCSFRSLTVALAAAALLALSSNAFAEAPPATEAFTGKVLQTMDAGTYTYAEVEAGEKKIWAAAPRTKLAVGDTVTVPAGMLMKNFTSKTLERTFEEIYFVPSLQAPGTTPAAPAPAGAPALAPGAAKAPAPIAAHRGNGAAPGSGALVAAIAKVADGFTVAELYAQKATLTGKPVAVRGRVAKFNSGILGKNWIHVEDGSGSEKDLTVTTDAVAKVGDTVVVRGVLGADRDFGAGYKYDIIIEDAAVTIE